MSTSRSRFNPADLPPLERRIDLGEPKEEPRRTSVRRGFFCSGAQTSGRPICADRTSSSNRICHHLSSTRRSSDVPDADALFGAEKPDGKLFGLPSRHVLPGHRVGVDRLVRRPGRCPHRCAVGAASDRPHRASRRRWASTSSIRDRDALPRLDVETIANDVAPSVVAVQSEIERFGQTGESIGSGLILTSDGEIVTNAHVVGDAKTVHVRLNGRERASRGSGDRLRSVA